MVRSICSPALSPLPDGLFASSWRMSTWSGPVRYACPAFSPRSHMIMTDNPFPDLARRRAEGCFSSFLHRDDRWGGGERDSCLCAPRSLLRRLGHMGNRGGAPLRGSEDTAPCSLQPLSLAVEQVHLRATLGLGRWVLRSLSLCDRGHASRPGHAATPRA